MQVCDGTQTLASCMKARPALHSPPPRHQHPYFPLYFLQGTLPPALALDVLEVIPRVLGS